MPDSSASPTAPARPGRNGLLLLTALLAIAAAAGGGYWYRRAHRVEVPAVATQDMEARLVAEIEKARSAVSAEPESAAAWGQVGLVLFANELYAQSRPWLERAEQMDQQDARWPYFRGLVLVLEQPDEGIAALKRAAELSPRDAAMRLRLAEELLKAGREEEAEGAFAEVLRLHPGNPRALLGRGQLLMRRGDAAAAAPLLEQAAEHPTARKSARAALAEARLRLGDDAAAELQRRLAAEAPKDANWPDPKMQAIAGLQVNLRGRLQTVNGLLAAGQLDEAVALLRRALRDRPDSGEAHLLLAKALIRVREFEQAEKELLRAIELEPQLADGYMLLGGLLVMQGDFAAAEKRYREALAVQPREPLAHFNIAHCRLKQNDRDGALAALKETIRYRPGFAPAQLQLGELLLESGRAGEAVPFLEAAARLEPKNDRARDLLAQARAGKKP